LGSHPGRVRSLLALPDGERLLSLGEGGAVGWRCGATEPLWRLELEAESWIAASDGAGAKVAIGASDCAVRLADAATGEVLHLLRHDDSRPVFLLERGASDAGIVGLAFLDGQGLLASAGLDGTVRLWDLASGELRHLARQGRDLLCLAGHAGRGLVASGGLDRSLRLYDGASGREVARLPH